MPCAAELVRDRARVTQVAEDACTKKVDSCSDQPKGGFLSCHRFYKCHNRVAYSRQNPKTFFSTCSEKYYFGSRKKYNCADLSRDSPGAKDSCEKT